HNTDAPALAAEIRRLRGGGAPGEDARALVVGSGGDGQAGVAALGVHLTVREIAVRARAFSDPARRDAFVATAPCPITPEAWGPFPGGEERTMTVVQATSAGMRGAEPGDAVAEVVAWYALPESAVAIDVVYAPRETPW